MPWAILVIKLINYRLLVLTNGTIADNNAFDGLHFEIYKYTSSLDYGNFSLSTVQFDYIYAWHAFIQITNNFQ